MTTINPKLGAFVSFLLFSDNVVRTGQDEYRTQCSLYKKGFTLSELYKYFVKNYSFN
jgi:hypothetical protein